MAVITPIDRGATDNDGTGLAGGPRAGAQLINANDAALNTELIALLTSMGIVTGATDLGTFTGTLLADNQTVKALLQSLEAPVEANSATIADLPFLRLTVGGAAGTGDLGVFTGLTITDNVDLRAALQELETAVEAGPTTTWVDSGPIYTAVIGDKVLVEIGAAVTMPLITAVNDHGEVRLVAEAGWGTAMAGATVDPNPADTFNPAAGFTEGSLEEVTLVARFATNDWLVRV